MKKNNIIILSVLIWVFSGCGEGSCDHCDDLGIYFSYSVKNSTNEKVTLTWFYPKQNPENVLDPDVFDVEAREEVVFYYDVSPPPHSEGLIRVPPFYQKEDEHHRSSRYDSVWVESSSKKSTYFYEDCHLPDNPLCEKNYIVKSINEKDYKSREWLFVIK